MGIHTLKTEVKEMMASLLEPWRNTSLCCPAAGLLQKGAAVIAGQGLANPTTQHNISHYRPNNLAYLYSDLAACCTAEDL
jgi:hypothetical protein